MLPAVPEPPTSDARRYSGTVAREVLCFTFFLALALLATRPLGRDLLGQMPAGSDPLIDLWTVHWISGHLFSPDLFGGNVFHPFPGAVLYSDLSLGTAVLVAPLRPVLRDPVAIYNAGLLLALAFGGWAFALLGRALTGRVDAGLLTGVLAAFGSHQMYHVYHLNLVSTGFVALFVLGVLRLFERPGPGAVILSGVSFALAAQSSGYYAVACAVIGIVVALVRWQAFRDRRVAAASLLAALLGLVLLFPYLHAFAALRGREGQALERDPALSQTMAFQPGRDLTSHGYLYGAVLGREGERLFPGILTLVLGGVALRRRLRYTGVLLATTGALLLLALGPGISLFGIYMALPYAALFALPPLDSMRHPYTFAAVATFLLATLAGIGWSSLAVSRRRGASALVVTLAILETLGPGLSVRAVAPGLPPVYERLLTLPPGAAVSLPVLDPESLLFAARHGRPVVNGAGAFTPLYTATLDRNVRNHWLRRVPEDVDASKPAEFLKRTFDTRYLILPTGRRHGFWPLAFAFDRSRGFRLVAETEDGDRIYEILRATVEEQGGRP
jgi:hypothetical protein